MMSSNDVSPEEMGALFAQPGEAKEPPKAATFPTFDPAVGPQVEQASIGLLSHVELEVAVRLGQTRRSVREILTLGPGSVLELDRLAGEAVDILVNGTLVAKGEVVVIGENFGVRITELVPAGGVPK